MSPIQKFKGIQTNIMIGKMTLSLPYCYWHRLINWRHLTRL